MKNIILTVLLSVIVCLPTIANSPANHGWIGAKVLHIVNANTVIIENMYTHKVETLIIARTQTTTDERINLEAIEFMKPMILGDFITVESYGHDKYGRMVGDIQVRHWGWLSYELIASGYVYWYSKFDMGSGMGGQLQDWARKHHSGVWKR